VLRDPVDPMLAAAVSALPEGRALPGGCWYEPKFDGYRALLLVDWGVARVQSRRGADLSKAFPEVAAAATAQLPADTVLDGELLIWTGTIPDFGALQRRMAARKNADAVAASQPASLVVFDVLEAAGQDLRGLPLRERRRVLEQLGTDLSPPLQLVPGTDDVTVARGWLADYGSVDVGIEGLVVKGLDTLYQPGIRGWRKYRLRDTAEAVVGAVIGSPASAERVILGRFDADGVLRIAGSTGELRTAQRRELAEHLVSAEPADHAAHAAGEGGGVVGGVDHPWPAEISTGRWGGGKQLIHRVEPTVVVEVVADRSTDHGRWRHVTRYVRVRTDLDPAQVTLSI
jgi:ATP-dependent DNA ligase